MAAPRTPLGIYRHLPGTNCGDCGARTCLALAAALVRGERRVGDCPHLAPAAAAAVAALLPAQPPPVPGQGEELARLRAAVGGLDLAAAARRLGVPLAAGRLVVKSLGKDFLVAPDGTLASDCHTHPGLAIPLLRYVVHGRGGAPSGRWVAFRDLAGAAGRELHFAQMVEKPLRRLLDAHTELLGDLIDLFAGERSVNLFGADVSLVLYPLPNLPLLLCYQRPAEGMASSVHVLLDETADRHLPAAWIHNLCGGLVEMFGRIAQRHA